MTETPTTETIPVRLTLTGKGAVDGAVAAGLVHTYEQTAGIKVAKALADGATILSMDVPPEKMESVVHFITKLRAHNIRVEEELG